MTTKEEHLIKVEEDLEPWLPREGEMKNILSAIAAGSMTLDQEIQKVSEGLKIKEANSMAELEELANATKISPRSDENIEEFRARLAQNFRKISSAGTAEDIILSLADLFDVEENDVKVKNIKGVPEFKAQIDDRGESDLQVSLISDVLTLVNNSSAENYKIDTLWIVGTLRHISPTEYENEEYDPDSGFATLDEDGDITSGGMFTFYRVYDNSYTTF